MIVIYRNGQRRVLTGWRAWLVVGPAMVLGAILTAALASLYLGIAFTVFTLLLFVLPLAIVILFIANLIQSRQYLRR